MVRGIEIAANLQQRQLQIKTSAAVEGTSKDLYIYFYSDSGSSGGLTLKFSEPMKYWISYCRGKYFLFSKTVPSGGDKVWGISRSGNMLKVECNGVLVLEYDVSQCDQESWSREIKQITFYKTDDASEEYRISSPGKLISRGSYCLLS